MIRSLARVVKTPRATFFLRSAVGLLRPDRHNRSDLRFFAVLSFVAQIFICRTADCSRQGVGLVPRVGVSQRLAGCNSAIQRTPSLSIASFIAFPTLQRIALFDLG